MIRTASDMWGIVLQDIIKHGTDIAPRGIKTVEVLSYQSLIDMQNPVVLTKARNLNYLFMAAEAWWILSGRDDSESIGKYCKNITQFADQDNGARFFGAYGPKIRGQLPYVIEKLTEDPTSRQAIISIWRECPPQTRDVPCTINVQWVIREGQLHCIDNMRSSDAWLGWPYDVFNFSMLSWYILERLRAAGMELTLGALCLHAGSQHLYENDMAKLARWNQATLEEQHTFDLFAGEPTECDIVLALGGCLDPGTYPPPCPFFREFRKLITTTHKK